jgi:hypothetical protein
MKIKVMEHGPFDCLVYRGVVDSIEEIPENYEKMIVEEETGVTVYISPLRETYRPLPRLTASVAP